MNRILRKPVAKLILDMSADNVLTSGYTEVEDSLGAPASAVEIFNGSASTLILATGDAGDEVEVPYYILPGGSSIMLPLNFSRGERVAVKAADVDSTTGTFVMNFFG